LGGRDRHHQLRDRDPDGQRPDSPRVRRGAIVTSPIPAEPALSTGSARRSRAGLIGTLVGAAAAGVAAGVAAERLILQRKQRGVERDPYKDEPFGELTADSYRTITTDEGITLHAEIDGDARAPLTVVFVHGFCLDMGTFH